MNFPAKDWTVSLIATPQTKRNNFDVDVFLIGIEIKAIIKLQIELLPSVAMEKKAHTQLAGCHKQLVAKWKRLIFKISKFHNNLKIRMNLIATANASFIIFINSRALILRENFKNSMNYCIICGHFQNSNGYIMYYFQSVKFRI